ncbi:MAG: hypothetical protein E7316_10805 [Clostridiales bacterium]|nr:hypothetical protein [Clostridiales bacterium]
MKKLLVLLLVTLWPAMAACGEAWTVETDDNPIYHIETFDETLPEEARQALASTPFAGDASIRGVLINEANKEYPEMNRQMLLMALEHEGTTLLVHGTALPDTGWEVWVASDTFLRAGEDFAISARPRYNSLGQVVMVWPTIEYGQEIFYIGGYEGSSYVYLYSHLDEQQNGVQISTNYPERAYSLAPVQNGKPGDTDSYWVGRPARLDIISAAEFPNTREKLQALDNTPWSGVGGTYVYAAHLREKPTGKSRSLGTYRWAIGEKLGSAPGIDFPWYQLRIGDTVGWMSGAYVIDDHGQAQPPAVAKSSREIGLYLSPDGEVKQTLPAGMTMQILADCNGWYHVVLPEEGDPWELAASGTFGYVRMGDVTEYATLLNMKYGVPARKK